jgi:hypothetical protein
MGKDKLHEGREWEYFNGFREGQKSGAVAFVIREYEKAKELGSAGSWDEANLLVLKIEGEIAMARELGLMTKKQAQRIHDRYSKGQTPV